MEEQVSKVSSSCLALEQLMHRQITWTRCRVSICYVGLKKYEARRTTESHGQENRLPNTFSSDHCTWSALSSKGMSRRPRPTAAAVTAQHTAEHSRMDGLTYSFLTESKCDDRDHSLPISPSRHHHHHFLLVPDLTSFITMMQRREEYRK